MPLDMNTLTALKRSSLGLDLYLWLTYRTFGSVPLSGSPGMTVVPSVWSAPSQSQRQPPCKPSVTRFSAIEKIKLAWPSLNYSTAPGVILSPSSPAMTGDSARAIAVAPQRPVSGRASVPFSLEPSESVNPYFHRLVSWGSSPRGETTPALFRTYG